MPEPPDLMVDDILDATKPEFSLGTILLFIAAVHEIPREYDFTKEAFEVIKREFNQDKINIKMANTFMYYFS